jgi:hypothetical protein
VQGWWQSCAVSQRRTAAACDDVPAACSLCAAATRVSHASCALNTQPSGPPLAPSCVGLIAFAHVFSYDVLLVSNTKRSLLTY